MRLNIELVCCRDRIGQCVRGDDLRVCVRPWCARGGELWICREILV